MRTIISTLLAILVLTSCQRDGKFTVEVMNSYTPVKQQAGSQLCWAYAMLSTIETEHIMKGDSVELSVAWVTHAVGNDPQAPSSGRGTALTLIHIIERHGLVPHYAMPAADDLPPRRAFMLGAEYTPLEFAHSVCAPGEYIGIGHDDSHPYWQSFLWESPDNWTGDSLLNVPLDSLLAITERAVRTHHGVCWEGDISEQGFDWKHGVATISPISALTSRLFPSVATDDHCMAIVGLARDEENRPYFVMKNSWGTANGQQGLLYMSFDYFRANTVAVILPKSCLVAR